jgi:hypothetical protein
LNGLADDVDEAILERHLSALRALVDEDVTYDVLLARVQTGRASYAGKAALMIMASDGAILRRMAKPHAPVRVMQALGADPALIMRMAERLTKAVRQDFGLWQYCPTQADLAALGARFPELWGALCALEAERPAPP